VNISSQQQENFESACGTAREKYRKMKYSVPTRWNSVYFMVTHALELRVAINIYISADKSKNNRLSKFKMSDMEWEQLEAVLAILHPFTKVSIEMQGTEKPGLHQVFFAYEELFDQIDRTVNSLSRGPLGKKPWSKTFGDGVTAMRVKLLKYYDRAGHPFAYSDAVLLDPKIKVEFFDAQQTFQGYWRDKYVDGFKRRFQESYAATDMGRRETTSSIPRKRTATEMDVDDDTNDYRKVVQNLRKRQRLKSEAEQYLEAEPDGDEISILAWWAKHQHRYPGLAKMARDVFAVPATGAGVEREFSKSGKVATATQARLNPETVEETMRYKDYLRRFEKAEMRRNEVRAEESGEEIEEEYQLDEEGQLFGVNMFRTKAPRFSRKY
jgi:hypothetical protein